MCNFGRNNDLDFNVCKYVFKIDSEKYRWGVPFFSTDRNAAAIVHTEMTFRENEIKAEYEKEIERIIANVVDKTEDKRCGLSISLMALTPDEICKAAVMVCRKSDQRAVPLNIDKDHHESR